MFWEIDHLGSLKGGVRSDANPKLLSYRTISSRVARIKGKLPTDTKCLAVLMTDNSPETLIAYLGLLNIGHAVMLVNASIDISLLNKILETYRPEYFSYPKAKANLPDGFVKLAPVDKDIIFAASKKRSEGKINPDTAILLSSSGTTGSPKQIRLSYANIQSNAQSIAEYLDIGEDECAITSLPFSYSYGLSVIHSHLLSGANLAMSNASLVTRKFWDFFRECNCTSFAGVPFMYSMLEKLHFSQMELPSLKTMTQAGGHLAKEKVKLFSDIATQTSRRLFVMYGQTEATARISYVPWRNLERKLESVGVSVPGGKIQLIKGDDCVQISGVQGEILYEGPNVMLGYAETRGDLSKSDELGGRLRTGDIGYFDDEKYLHITGRTKRFLKIYGLRLSLDEVERMLESRLSIAVACIGTDENLHIFLESMDASDAMEASRLIVELYKLHHSNVLVHPIEAIPSGNSGKKDYAELAKKGV